jgi:hypothetical protein
MPALECAGIFLSKDQKMKSRTFILLLLSVLLLVVQAGSVLAQSEALVEKRGIVVNPIDRSQLQSLVDAGTIETEGYSDLVLNMAGIPSAATRKSGAVGAILIPDIPPFDEAFRKWGILPAIIELTAEVKAGDTSFVAKQKSFDVGFPRYRLLLYNTTDSNMTVAFFAYRTIK